MNIWKRILLFFWVAATAISMVPAARGSKLPVILKAKQQWHCLRDGQKNRRSTFFVVSGNVQTKQIKNTLNNPHRFLVKKIVSLSFLRIYVSRLLHGTGIVTYMYHTFMPDVGKYSIVPWSIWIWWWLFGFGRCASWDGWFSSFQSSKLAWIERLHGWQARSINDIN